MTTKLASTSAQFLSGEIGGVDGDLVKYTGGASSGDVIRMAKLQAGTRLDAVDLITDSSNAGATAKVGWAYVDGSASDDDEIIVATSIATALRLSQNSATPPTVLAKDAYLIVTIGGASISSGTVLSLVTKQKFLGTP